jgi:serine/threonine protein kinase
MFQIEIYEYTPKMSDLYHHFYGHIENKTPGNNNNSGHETNMSGLSSNHHIEDTIENKFLRIKSISHPVVCGYLDSIKEDNNYIFISESGGDSLDEIIDTKLSENVAFKTEDVASIIYQLLIGVNYLEKKGVYLRFLDSKRILLNEETGGVKIKNYLVDVLFKSEELKFLKYLYIS